MIELSVNINKIAWLRNSRGGDRPNVLNAARTAIAHGAYGITVHPRSDLRHIRPDDVRALAKMLRAEHPGIEFNIEGNPFAEANDIGYPGYPELVAECQPDQCTLVPDGDDQLTSDHGWNMAQDGERLAPMLARLKPHCHRISLFMDASLDEQHLRAEFARVRDAGAERIELYTGPFADGFKAGLDATATLAPFRLAARVAAQLGLGVNAGHDLDQHNLPLFATIHEVLEVSIGHALIADALEIGLDTAVARYVGVLRTAALRLTNAGT